MNLWVELKRRHAALTRNMVLDDMRAGGAEPLSDVIDQASVDREQELTLIGKSRLRDQLREIDAALEFMERNAYGLCIYCRQEIPIARLRVQPSALLCVPCQADDERKSPVAGRRSRHESTLFSEDR